MKRLGLYTDDHITNIAIRNTIKNISNSPILEEFLKDLSTKEFKKWEEYKKCYSEATSMYSKGRSVPIRTGGGSSNSHRDRIRMANLSVTTNNATIGHYSKLPLEKCKTVKEKIKMIYNANIPMEIKVELLSAI